MRAIRLLAKGVALGLWMGWLMACNRAPSPTPLPPTFTPIPTNTPLGWTLTPYLTPTATATPAPLPSPTLRPLSGASPTPWVYTVAEGDTLLGIALRFGVTLEALKSANPGVNPQLLSIGTRLLIPINPDNPAALPTPTPLPLRAGAPLCAPAVDGGLVCLVVVTNDTEQPVEAVSVLLALENGATAEAEALLGLLPPGKHTVAVARFAAPQPPHAQAAVRVLRALPAAAEGLTRRYPPTTVTAIETEIAPDGAWARVSGKVALQGQDEARLAWVVAVGYDALGRPVAARRWESPYPPAPKQKQPFALVLYSVGPPIQRVEVMAEAHGVTATPTVSP